MYTHSNRLDGMVKGLPANSTDRKNQDNDDH